MIPSAELALMWVYAMGVSNAKEMMMTKMNDADANTTIRLDPDLRAFLREYRSGQCLAIAAWASRILKAGKMTLKDVERCFCLGFQG